MKTLFALLFALTLSLPAFGEHDSEPHYPSYSDGSGDAWRNAQQGNQRYVDRLIRREIARRKAAARRAQQSRVNCGKSFWKKREALRSCPPATAMKAYYEGQAYYYCDCE